MRNIRETKIINIKGDWTEVLNDCRHTVSKPPLDKEPSESFIKRVLISEHSPIRSVKFKWLWEGIKSWISVHWVRHSWECFVGTQRTDRTGIDRNKLPQDQPVNFIGEMNIQNAIDTQRKRLCFQAAAETREYAEDLKLTLHEYPTMHYVADVMVPNCVYRCGCPEHMGDPCEFFEKLNEQLDGALQTTDIQARYDAYNEWFYETHNKEGESNE